MFFIIGFAFGFATYHFRDEIIALAKKAKDGFK